MGKSVSEMIIHMKLNSELKHTTHTARFCGFGIIIAMGEYKYSVQ